MAPKAKAKKHVIKRPAAKDSKAAKEDTCRPSVKGSFHIGGFIVGLLSFLEFVLVPGKVPLVFGTHCSGPGPQHGKPCCYSSRFSFHVFVFVFVLVVALVVIVLVVLVVLVLLARFRKSSCSYSSRYSSCSSSCSSSLVLLLSSCYRSFCSLDAVVKSVDGHAPTRELTTQVWRALTCHP
jgi:hypothetical protein